MARVSKQALLNIAHKAGVTLEFKGGWVRKEGDTNWFRWIQMYRRISYRMKKDACIQNP